MPNISTEKSFKFIDLVKKRKTTYEFTKKGVSNANIKKMIHAAMYAPNFENYQPWKFIIIKDKKKISNIMSHSAYGSFHSEPTTIIILVFDAKSLKKRIQDFEKENMNIQESIASINIAGEHMILQATELGISTCLLAFKAKELNKLLKIPEENSVILGIGLGYEKKGAFQKEKDIRPYDEIISYEKF